MNVLDLFSGIGGFSLGLERAGFRTSAFCEIDPYCRRVLAKHWPDVPVHTDIRQLDGTRYAGTVDVVCGGYPCQPFSTAGKQQGETDPRHLWPEMRRVVRDARPRWVVCENVRGHVGLGFDAVAAQLEDDGFTVWPFLVPACAVGAPHRRDRLWIVAHHPGDGRGAWRAGRPDPGGAGQPEQALPAGEHAGHVADAGGRRRSGAEEGQVEQPQRTEAECPGEALAHTAARDHRSPNKLALFRAGRRDQGGAAAERGGRTAEPGVGGGLDGISRWLDGSWEAGIPRVATGVADRVDRLRALGNGVVPEIPYRLGRAIRTYEHGLAA